MLSKRFVPILLALLVIPAASSTAAPATPSPAPSVAPSWLGGSAACGERATAAQVAGTEGARTPAGLPATPFAERQNETGFCPDPHGCDDFCNNVCAPCGGYPYSQCLQNVNRPGCRAICWCYVC